MANELHNYGVIRYNHILFSRSYKYETKYFVLKKKGRKEKRGGSKGNWKKRIQLETERDRAVRKPETRGRQSK